MIKNFKKMCVENSRSEKKKKKKNVVEYGNYKCEERNAVFVTEQNG